MTPNFQPKLGNIRSCVTPFRGLYYKAFYSCHLASRFVRVSHFHPSPIFKGSLECTEGSTLRSSTVRDLQAPTHCLPIVGATTLSIMTLSVPTQHNSTRYSYAECCYAQCHFMSIVISEKAHYAECHYSECFFAEFNVAS